MSVPGTLQAKPAQSDLQNAIAAAIACAAEALLGMTTPIFECATKRPTGLD